MTATPDIRPVIDEQPTPGNYLTAMCHSILHAIELTKAGNLYEAGEHVDAVERLIGGYRDVMGEPERGPGRQVQPVADDFPQGAALNRLKQALIQFRATEARNTLADDLAMVLEFVEFTRADIKHLRRSWAAVTWCLMEQARHKELTDAHLADVPVSHRAYLQGHDALRRELRQVVEQRDQGREKAGKTA
ncbi:MAG: hypothetical protein HOY75_08190 [Streptomyces sp.]|nr:hypothetical protein [Streptomyces sp.]